MIESQVRGLRVLGAPPDSYGSFLSSVLVNKLPQELQLILSREVRREEWELDGLMEIVERELEARERAAIGNSAKPPSRIPPTATD